MSSKDCPSRERLCAYLVGRLSDEDSEQIANHVDTCPVCQATMATLDDADDTLAARLRSPAEQDAYANEPQRAEFLARAKAIVGGVTPAGVGLASEPPGESTVLGILGEYQLIEELGQGGMGTVYKARQTKLKRSVALKVLPKERMQDQRAVARFEREMEAVGAVDHPNIVRAMDAREIDGIHFLVMEHVEGLDLSELLKQSGPLGIADACELIRQAALGLQCVHENGLVHRDIKPSNLMLTGNGQVKILDLGLALLGTDQPAGEEMTGTGIAMGTSDYMAPEQAADSHKVDIRADIYALGCTLYRLLTGHAPFHGPEYKNNLEKMMGHMRDPVPPIRQLRPDVPEDLAALIDRMLAKNPEERFSTPAEIVTAIEPFSTDSDLPALAKQARDMVDVRLKPQPSLGTTEDFHSSALAGTQPSAPGSAGGRAAVRAAADIISHPSPGKAGGSGRAIVTHVLKRVIARRKPLTIAIGTMLLAAGLVAALSIIISIRHPDGRETIVKVPEGSRVKIEPGQVDVELPEVKAESGKRKAEGKKEPLAFKPIKIGPPVKVEPVKIEIKPDPLPEIKPGEPMSNLALVANPAKLPGVRSWTLATVGHDGPVSAMAYTADGRVLATGTRNGIIRLWDTNTCQLTRVLVGHDDCVLSLAWSPDGKYLASMSSGGTIKFWDVQSALLVRTHHAYPAGGGAIAWSPDGRMIVSSDGSSIDFWAGRTAKRLKNKRAHDSWVTSFAWSPDGKRFASASVHDNHPSPIKIWDAESGTVERSLQAAGGVRSVCWSPDGKIVLATTHHPKSTLQLWNVVTGEPFGPPTELPGHSAVGSVLSPDGRTLAIGAGGWTTSRVYCWHVEARKLVPLREIPLSELRCLAFSPDGKTLAIGGGDGTVRRWSRQSDSPLPLLPGYAKWSEYNCIPIAFCPTENTLAYGTRNPGQTDVTIRLWQADPCRLPRALEGRAGYHRGAGLAWSLDGTVLAGTIEPWGAVEGSSRVHIWSVKSDTRVSEFDVPDWIISLSPNGRTLATGGADGTKVQLRDVTQGRVLRELRVSGSSHAWSPDGKSIAVRTSEGIAICDSRNSTVLQTLSTDQCGARGLAWRPDGKALATVNEHGVCYISDVQSGRLLVTFKNSFASCSLRWLADGKTLICASNYRVCMWDTHSSKFLREIEVGVHNDKIHTTSSTHNNAGHSVSSDGRLIAIQFPNMIRLRSLADGQLLRTLAVLRDGQSAIINPDGHFHGTPGVEDEFVYVVQTDTGQQTLTPEEFTKKYGWKNDPTKVGIRKSEVGTPKAEEKVEAKAEDR